MGLMESQEEEYREQKEFTADHPKAAVANQECGAVEV